MPLHKKCITCGKDFKVPPSRESAKYCSQDCMPKGGNNNPHWQGGKITLKCAVCGNDFSVKKSKLSKNPKYCSLECKYKGESKPKENYIYKRVIKNCIVCGKGKVVKLSHIEIAGTYCSNQCMAIDYVNRFSGEGNPNYKHGKAHISNYYESLRTLAEGSYPKDLPEKLFELQRKRCAGCGKKMDKYTIDHIIPITKGGTNWPENIQLLCKSCNCKKNAKDPIKWANELGRLL